MRKLFLSAAFAASLTISYAQDLKDVQEKISKGKYDEAKEKLDKFMADPKNANNATAYYWKGKINTYYAQTDTAGTLTYDAAGEAFTAYKKNPGTGAKECFYDIGPEHWSVPVVRYALQQGY